LPDLRHITSRGAYKRQSHHGGTYRRSLQSHELLPLEDERRGRQQRQLAHASLLPGAPNNKYFTSMQLNYSSVGKGLSQLKRNGELHPDQHDYWTMLTAMVVFSNHSDGFFGGYLYHSAKTYHSNYAMFDRLVQCQIFSCREWPRYLHGAPIINLRLPPIDRVRIPEPLPREDYPSRRLTIPIYANAHLITPRFSEFNPEAYTWKGGNMLYKTRAARTVDDGPLHCS